MSLKASLLIMASFGLVAYGAVQWKHSKRMDKVYGDELVSGVEDTTILTSAVAQIPSIAHLEKETKTPVAAVVSQEVRLDRVIRANVEHVTLGRSIVIFKNGTCVLVQEPSRNPVDDARLLLKRCSSSEIKFKTHQVEQGRTIVAFEEGAVFHWLFPDDVAAVSTKDLDEIKLLLGPAELSTIQQNWNPPLHARLGLTARKWLATDVAGLEVVKILKGSPLAAGETKVGQILPTDAP